jgi:hypothetical protein
MSAWSGPCTVIFRRHPNGGYLATVCGTGPHATLAQGVVATADPPLTLRGANALRDALRGLNLHVDDRVLKIDEGMRQWVKALPFAIIGGLIVAAVVEESIGSVASTILLVAISLAIGAAVRHVHERNGGLIPSPWVLPLGALAATAAVGGLWLFMPALSWTQANVGGLGGALLLGIGATGAYGGVVLAVTLVRARVLDVMRPRRTPASGD